MIKNLVKNKTLYGGFLVLILWYLIHFIVKSMVTPSPVPTPHETIMEFVALIKGPLIIHLMTSLYRMVLSIILALAIGVTIGLFLGFNERYDQLISPMIYLLYPVPKIAFLPVLMILFGLGNLSKIILITLIILFQILVTTRDSVKGLSKAFFYSMHSLGARRFDMYRHLIIPAVLPKILTSIRVSTGTSIAVLFFAENYATRYGIGYFIMDSWTRVDYVQMFAGILALSIMGLSLFKLIDLLEGKLCRWVVLEKVNLSTHHKGIKTP